MAKWAFEDNVPKVRPRLRLGRSAEEVVDAVTEPPPVRPREEASPESEAPVTAEAEPRRRSPIRDIIATADEVAAELAPTSEAIAPPAPEPTFEPEALATPTEQEAPPAIEEAAALEAPVAPPPEREEPAFEAAVAPVDHVSHIAVPAVGEATSIPESSHHEEAPVIETAKAEPVKAEPTLPTSAPLAHKPPRPST